MKCHRLHFTRSSACVCMCLRECCVLKNLKEPDAEVVLNDAYGSGMEKQQQKKGFTFNSII